MIDFFIIGNPRSGTTLLRLMLTAHDNIIVPPEAGFALWLSKNWDYDCEYTNARFVDELFKTTKIENWSINAHELQEYLDFACVDNLFDAIMHVYRFYALNMGKSDAILGDKNNFYLHHIDDLYKLSPKAKFIHIVRDGRDVACSYQELMAKKISSEYAPNLPQNIRDIAREWLDNNIKITKDLKGKNSYRVRLEDIIESPEQTLNKLCEFLGIEFDKNMLNYYADHNFKSFEPAEFDQWKAKNKKPIINDNYKYRKILSETDIKEFQDEAGALLELFGYQSF